MRILQHFSNDRQLIQLFKDLLSCVGDEVVVIQGKLDGIKSRYADISTMSNDVMKTLDKALSLANKVQNTHEELRFWLEKVECELATFGAQEPVGEQLTQVQVRQKVSTLFQLKHDLYSIYQRRDASSD